jgi:hypothetical protein
MTVVVSGGGDFLNISSLTAMLALDPVYGTPTYSYATLNTVAPYDTGRCIVSNCTLYTGGNASVVCFEGNATNTVCALNQTCVSGTVCNMTLTLGRCVNKTTTAYLLTEYSCSANATCPFNLTCSYDTDAVIGSGVTATPVVAGYAPDVVGPVQFGYINASVQGGATSTSLGLMTMPSFVAAFGDSYVSLQSSSLGYTCGLRVTTKQGSNALLTPPFSPAV